MSYIPFPSTPIFAQLVYERGYPFGGDYVIHLKPWDEWTELFSHYRIGHKVGARYNTPFCWTCRAEVSAR